MGSLYFGSTQEVKERRQVQLASSYTCQGKLSFTAFYNNHSFQSAHLPQAAHVIYDNNKDATAAAAAKQELTQQIFTKTMTIQVWKPEFERPGRHFVYTTRYAYFFVNLLDQLDDRASLDQLLRRVRKRQGDFINHTKLWEDICLTYFKVRKWKPHCTEERQYYN